jgi:hypothetical protein
MEHITAVAVALVLLLAKPVRAQGDPQVALWTGIKRELNGPDGQQYFEDNVKGAALPRLTGTLASALINEGVSRVILKMAESEQPEVTLVVHNGAARVRGTPAVGTKIEFSGIAREFTKRPFMLTFDVELADLTGLEFVKPPSE